MEHPRQRKNLGRPAVGLLKDLSRTGYYGLVRDKFKSRNYKDVDGEPIKSMQQWASEMGAIFKKLADLIKYREAVGFPNKAAPYPREIYFDQIG